MPRKAQVQIPEMRDPKAEVAAAAQAAAEAAKKTSRPQTTSEIEWNSRGTHVVKGNQYHSDLWVLGPAQIELMVSAYHKLVSLGETDGGEVRHVTKVRVGRVKRSKNIRITPTDDADPDGLEVKSVGGHWVVNAITILGPAKLTVASGYRERFTVSDVPGDGSEAPALEFNIGKPIVRKVAARRKAAQAADGTGTAAPAKAAKSDTAKPEPDKTET